MFVSGIFSRGRRTEFSRRQEDQLQIALSEAIIEGKGRWIDLFLAEASLPDYITVILGHSP